MANDLPKMTGKLNWNMPERTWQIVRLGCTIGDPFPPREQRFTQTNIRKSTKTTALMESGLFEPVQVLEQN
jgi:hypothetical protein